MSQSQPTIGRGLTFLFAVAAGAAVGNLYWAQPLLDLIAGDLGTSAAHAGWLVTTTQLGYALGILLVVPLGDVTNRRRLVPLALLAAAVALGLCAVAPSFGFLVAALGLVGLVTVGGQLLTPLAGDLATDADRGAVVGTVVSGILSGILLSRTVSGFVADAFGWRSIYIGAAVLDVVLAVLLYRAIPDLEPKARVRYPALIASVFTVIRRERIVRWTLVLAGIGFALFTMFWTALTFLLSGPPFSYPVSVIGLFGLVGLAAPSRPSGPGACTTGAGRWPPRASAGGSSSSPSGWRRSHAARPRWSSSRSCCSTWPSRGSTS